MKGDIDEDLVRAFKAGNEHAFDELYAKYRISIYSICYRFVRNEADAQELTQDVFRKIFKNLVKFHEKSKFFTWAYRITVNTCLSFKRKYQPPIIEYDPANLDQSLEKRVMMKIAVDKALGKLPDRQRMCFILHHYEGYTFNEIGNIMRITTGAVKAHHHLAIKKLRCLLKGWL